MFLKLKNGSRAQIRPLKRSDDAKEYLSHINALVKERAFLLCNEIQTLKKERAWLKKCVKEVTSGKAVFLTAWIGRHLIGLSSGISQRGADSGNVEIGLSVRKQFRGQGVGEALILETIFESKKKLRPKNIYLRVYAENKPALKLYKKMGFKTLALFPKWSLNKGKLKDVYYMVLK